MFHVTCLNCCFAFASNLKNTGTVAVKNAGKIMEFVRAPPQSVFKIQHAAMMGLLQRLKTQQDKAISLYPHQVEAVLALCDYFDPQTQSAPNSSNIALVVLPTGCGKTGVAVLASYALNASRVLVITPSIIISRQIHEAYGNFLIQHGVVPDTPEVVQAVLPTRSLIKKSSEIKEGWSLMVMVVNAHKIGGQSSVGIDEISPEGYDLVIVDEAHHYPAPTWKKLVDHFSNSRRLFLTATPEHKGIPILSIPPCYELKRSVAIHRGIIRDVMFDETTGGDEEYQYSVSYCYL